MPVADGGTLSLSWDILRISSCRDNLRKSQMRDILLLSFRRDMGEFVAKTPEQLGEILRGYRRRRGYTQQQLAERLALPQKAISVAERHPERMTLTRLFQLLGALGVELTLEDQASRSAPEAEW
jgi:HTH-type transcriptional regulator / antitoxin HipB